METLDQYGEAETGKKCPTCGVAGLVLRWRPADAGGSSPLTRPAWFPTTPVCEAKMTCPRPGCLPMTAYGLLVGGNKDDDGRLAGEFLLRDPRETVLW